MVTSNDIGGRWAALAAAGEDERGAQMRVILNEVLALDEGARIEVVRQMVEAEYALPDAQLKPFTVSRLRTWLAIAGSNLESAQSIARGYDAAFEKMPGAAAMRRSTTVQGVARDVLTVEEVQGLFALIPSIVRQVPRAIPPSTPRPPKPDEAPSKKPFWKFW